MFGGSFSEDSLCVTADASDLAGLLPVPHGPEEGDQDEEDFRSSTPGSPSHPTPEDMAAVHQVCLLS